MGRSLLPALATAALLCSAVSLAFAEKSSTTKVTRSKDTLTIKTKLETAESRVTDLISRLDSVSDDATRAKSEIHRTLTEVWKVVDLLGKDQCGEVVDKVRVAQKKAENRVGELEDEVRVHMKDIEKLKLEIGKASDTMTALRTEIEAERSRREALETESRELRDKLYWANAVSNETQKYERVAERLQNLLVIVTERTALLKRVSTMVGDAHAGFADWQREIEGLASVVRKTERDFSSGYKGAAMDGLRRHVTELERRLRDAVASREALAEERNTLRSSVEELRGNEAVLRQSAARSAVAPAAPVGDSAGRRERIIVRSEAEDAWSGWLALGLISFCSGGLLTMVLGYWQEGRPGGAAAPGGAPNAPNTPGGESDKFGFTPGSGRGSSRGSPGVGLGTSPLTFVNDGTGPRTPGSRGSTPSRRY